MISEERIKLLFKHYIEGISSTEEVQEFLILANNPEHKVLLMHLMEEHLNTYQFSEGLNNDQKKKILDQVFAAEESLAHSSTIKFKKLFPVWKKLLAVAAILFLLSIGIYFIRHEYATPRYISYKGDLVPGGSKATLTLANGQKLSLTDAANGKLAEQSGVSIKKTAHGKLLYEIKDGSTAPVSGFNTISTPAGGQYQVILPDGSHIWLNSSSTLKYPVSFAEATKRKVELNGEAYFEIAKRNNQKGRVPFIVASKGQEVEVLGTHFNINSYEEEEFTATTLLEGSVKVYRSAVFDQTIKPGEQARVNTNIQVVHVDTTIAVAWKNGLFKFDNANISNVMNQFSRWYDVDVEYQGKMPANKFNGEVYRNMNASKVFKILSFASINFTIEAPANNNGRKRIIIKEN